MSQDGFIAGENDNIDFLNAYQVEGEDYGYKSFITLTVAGAVSDFHRLPNSPASQAP